MSLKGINKYLFISLIILSLTTSGCVGNSNYNGEYSPEDTYYDELEEKFAKLEKENQELKDRLDEINTMATERCYDYDDLLDDIEFESDY